MVTNLQRQNFREILQKMVNVPGWEVLEQNHLLALKSPVSTPLVNMVWGEVTEENYNSVMDFYKKAEFYWLLDSVQINNIPDKLQHLFVIHDEDSRFPEMVFNLQDYVKRAHVPEINITIPKTKDELQLWTETAIATLGIKECDWQQFFYPLIDIVKCIPLLLYYNQQPAGTALVYCSNQVAGIYAMSTKQEFRRRKIGTSAVHACLEIAKAHDSKYAVLYASNLGTHLYKSIGFELSQYLWEFGFNKNKSQTLVG